MFCKIISFAVVLVFVAIAPLRSHAKCNACGSNNIACFNETSFYMCFGGVPDTSNPIPCPDGRICTRSQMKCVEPAPGAEPDCIPNKGCGICHGENLFTCTSRTTFAMCNDKQLIDVKGVCPPGLICDSRNTEICVNKCNLPDELECDRETPL